MKRAIFLGVAAVSLLGATPAPAASLTLTAAQHAEALRVGQRSTTSDAPFDTEWRVSNEAGESVLVLTPFHRLALASRHATFRNEPLKPQDQDKLLGELRDRLTFWVELSGPRADFARYYTPRLVVEEREIAPLFVQNERTALRRTNGSYLARSVYTFPAREITGQSRLVLLIRDGEGALKSRFAIELGRMR